MPDGDQLPNSITTQLLTLSAHTDVALSNLVKRYADMLNAEDNLKELSLTTFAIQRPAVVPIFLTVLRLCPTIPRS